jgi:hypothetical protein
MLGSRVATRGSLETAHLEREAPRCGEFPRQRGELLRRIGDQQIMPVTTPNSHPRLRVLVRLAFQCDPAAARVSLFVERKQVAHVLAAS